MDHFLHHTRDQNGFLKQATVSINSSVNLSNPMIFKFPNPTLEKASGVEEWSNKVVSNKIKIVALAYNLVYESLVTSAAGSYVQKFPVRIDVVRQNQTISGENAARYTTNNSYLLKHTFGNPSPQTNTIDAGSMWNFPLERPELGHSRLCSSDMKMCSPNVDCISYNSNNLTSVYRPPIAYFSKLLKVDALVDIPDDGNPLTTINLSACVGEIPEVFLVTTYSLRTLVNPFPMTNQFYINGQITILYQDCGTKLTHL